MLPNLALKIDRLIGVPVCVLLSAWERIRRTFLKRQNALPKKILFIKLIEMGATVLACPAFAEAVRIVGKENIYILVFAENRQIVDIIPFFENGNVITVDHSSLTKLIHSLLRALLFIRRKKIDAAIDMEGLTRSSAIITSLSGARIRVGLHNFTSEGPYRGRLLTHELNYNFQHHVSKVFLAMVQALNNPTNQVPFLKEKIENSHITLPRFVQKEKEKKDVLEMIGDRTEANLLRPIVVLNPNCNDLLPLRRWPMENFVELGKRLLFDFPRLMIVITGTSSEEHEATNLVSEIGSANRVISLVGCTTLQQLLTLYSMSDLLISSDSGPCHFASLTAISIIAIFGPETPLLYAPIGDRITIISTDLMCSPCLSALNHRSSPCTDNKCMQRISVDEVFRASVTLLGSRNTHH